MYTRRRADIDVVTASGIGIGRRARGRRERNGGRRRRAEARDWKHPIAIRISRRLIGMTAAHVAAATRRVRSRSAPAVTVRPCISRDISLWRRPVDDFFASSPTSSFHRLRSSCLPVQKEKKKIKSKRRRRGRGQRSRGRR